MVNKMSTDFYTHVCMLKKGIKTTCASLKALIHSQIEYYWPFCALFPRNSYCSSKKTIGILPLERKPCLIGRKKNGLFFPRLIFQFCYQNGVNVYKKLIV